MAFSFAWQAATTWQLSIRATRPSATPRRVASRTALAAGAGWTPAVGQYRVVPVPRSCARVAPRRVAAVEDDRGREAAGADAGQRGVELPVGQEDGVRRRAPCPWGAALLGGSGGLRRQSGRPACRVPAKWKSTRSCGATTSASRSSSPVMAASVGIRLATRVS